LSRHNVVTAYAQETHVGLDGTGTAGSTEMQQLLAERQQGFARAISHKAEEANTNEAMRERMEK